MLIFDRFAGPQQLAVLVGKLQTIRDLEVELAHLRAALPVTAL